MDLEKMARELGKAIQQDPRYLAFQAAKEKTAGSISRNTL